MAAAPSDDTIQQAEKEKLEPSSSQTTQQSSLKEKSTTSTTRIDHVEDGGMVGSLVVADMETMALKALHVDDDASQNPWTVRMLLLGLLLGSFGAALSTIFMFRPQWAWVSTIFLTVIIYVLGNGMAWIVPRKGRLGRWLNPHDFNCKEHLAVVIMASSASGVAYATDVLAAQKLFYDVVPRPLASIGLMLSSQLLGYGMAGVLRRSLVYPTRMLWPFVLPLNSLIETLHRERNEMKKRFRVFWIVLVATAVYEILPQYMMTVLAGVSVFCLANRNSLLFTNLFGGANSNEGLGLLSLCFDWQYVGTGCFMVPLISLFNCFIGYVICAGLLVGLYYTDVWGAMSYPFLSQQLFSEKSNSSHFVIYNQTAVLDNYILDESKLEAEGLPRFATTWALHLLTTNLGVGATFVHIFLWQWDLVRDTFSRPDLAKWRGYLARPLSLFRRADPDTAEEKETDPHYLAMLAYSEVPATWYLTLFVASVTTALICIYVLESTLPWWGLLLAVTLSFSCTLFFGLMTGIFGFHAPISPVVQLICGLMFPGRPVSNMYFVLFGANAQAQALHLVGNLKMGQYGKLSPRCNFAVTLLGTVLGALINYYVMNTITTNQRAILLSIEGTNIWSGQAVQGFNTNAIAYGAFSSRLFGPTGTYRWVVLALPLGLIMPLPFWLAHRRFPRAGFDYIATPIICLCMGFLAGGMNSPKTVEFVLGFFFQFWVRKRYPAWFLRYNYLLSAAISGGCELLILVTTFGLQGGAGNVVEFPTYWGNPKGNLDYCMKNPALGSKT